MLCPLCTHTETRVLRTIDEAERIRRSRECRRCGHRWATSEILTVRVRKLEELETAARKALETV